jgi:nicotinate-nucleotide pyrophosphorylase (carboxylating)
LEKFAVRAGGGHNHRLGLYDGILIKDNQLAALRSVRSPVNFADLIRQVRERVPGVPIEIEVDNLEQFTDVLNTKPDIILLDNMEPTLLCEAVARRNREAPGVRLEASGGITLETLRTVAETGVDRISIGTLTHSAPALDIGLDYEY